ncbi:MAG: terminase small subunit [Oscillospiraceae bacterium]|nr:terminase small subunit [Oscillospiraceae bacterium]
MARKKISPERVLQELAAIAFARVPDYMDSDGTLKLGLKPLQGAAIASIEKGSAGVKVKFYDKMKALELLGKHFGLSEMCRKLAAPLWMALQDRKPCPRQ